MFHDYAYMLIWGYYMQDLSEGGVAQIEFNPTQLSDQMYHPVCVCLTIVRDSRGNARRRPGETGETLRVLLTSHAQAALLHFTLPLPTGC